MPFSRNFSNRLRFLRREPHRYSRRAAHAGDLPLGWGRLWLSPQIIVVLVCLVERRAICLCFHLWFPSLYK